MPAATAAEPISVIRNPAPGSSRVRRDNTTREQHADAGADRDGTPRVGVHVGVRARHRVRSHVLRLRSAAGQTGFRIAECLPIRARAWRRSPGRSRRRARATGLRPATRCDSAAPSFLRGGTKGSSRLLVVGSQSTVGIAVHLFVSLGSQLIRQRCRPKCRRDGRNCAAPVSTIFHAAIAVWQQGGARPRRAGGRGPRPPERAPPVRGWIVRSAGNGIERGDARRRSVRHGE